MSYVIGPMSASWKSSTPGMGSQTMRFLGMKSRCTKTTGSARFTLSIASQVMSHHFLRFSSHSTPQCRRTYHSGKSPSSRMSTARS